jgi:hypothetical protein
VSLHRGGKIVYVHCNDQWPLIRRQLCGRSPIRICSSATVLVALIKNFGTASPRNAPTMSFVTETHIQFNRRIGLDLAGKTVGVARAMIEDAIDCQFYGPTI